MLKMENKTKIRLYLITTVLSDTAFIIPDIANSLVSFAGDYWQIRLKLLALRKHFFNERKAFCS
jgi:hypothetical protein